MNWIGGVGVGMGILRRDKSGKRTNKYLQLQWVKDPYSTGGQTPQVETSDPVTRNLNQHTGHV